MILFDTNILIYAHREDQSEHVFYREWLERTVTNGSLFGLSPLVAAGFVRIVTHPRFPNGPTPVAQALAVVDSLIAVDYCRWTNPSDRHWPLVASLCRETLATGKLVADAQHAAIAIEHAGTWVTRDTDFEPFTKSGLKLQILAP